MTRSLDKTDPSLLRRAASATSWDAHAQTWHIGYQRRHLRPGTGTLLLVPGALDAAGMLRYVPKIPAYALWMPAYAVWMPRICSLDAPGQLTRVCTVALTLSPGLPYIRSTRGRATPSPSGAHFPPRSQRALVEKLTVAIEVEQHRSRDILSDI